MSVLAAGTAILSSSIVRLPSAENFVCCERRKTTTTTGKRSASIVVATFGGGGQAHHHPHPDPPFRAAIAAASIRYQESLRPDPLFIDPFAGCFVSSVTSQKDEKEQCLAADLSYPCHYRLATKFIDDKITSTLSSSNELRQIVLLTDGMDTRPYRLRWPLASVIYDISPERVFKEASQQLEGAGAKISKSCMLIHIPQESSDLQTDLCKKGFNGSRPSLWILQGLPLVTLESLKHILSIFASLAMKGCIFVGELQDLLLDVEFGNMSRKKDLMESIFRRHGLQVDMVGYDEVARTLHLDPLSKDNGSILFIARQLRYSDAQMETWRAHFERLEDEADEEGFDEL
ncbi:uncharacterized protein M6B38_261000 [Iris pallida]|uniref:S-adenosyl-L-methionine-dependent methyltransferase n=1 Tax=Iris pallida TaxID=29817 RepID=A0AAX6IEC2_IRIPA|nr:uncharacterized protein M6B38_261000 [Iris pallida]